MFSGAVIPLTTEAMVLPLNPLEVLSEFAKVMNEYRDITNEHIYLSYVHLSIGQMGQQMIRRIQNANPSIPDEKYCVIHSVVIYYATKISRQVSRLLAKIKTSPVSNYETKVKDTFFPLFAKGVSSDECCTQYQRYCLTLDEYKMVSDIVRSRMLGLNRLMIHTAYKEWLTYQASIASTKSAPKKGNKRTILETTMESSNEPFPQNLLDASACASLPSPSFEEAYENKKMRVMISLPVQPIIAGNTEEGNCRSCPIQLDENMETKMPV